MKAPDKIYLPIIEEEGRKLLCTNWWEEDRSPRNAYVNETIEYINKDALMEWANREDVKILKKIPSNGNVWSNGYLCGMKDLIDKLNSM